MLYQENAATAMHTMLIRYYVILMFIYRSFTSHKMKISFLYLQQSKSTYMVKAVDL